MSRVNEPLNPPGAHVLQPWVAHNVEVLAYIQEYIFKGLMKKLMSGKISPIGSREPDLDLMSLFGDAQKGDAE